MPGEGARALPGEALPFPAAAAAVAAAEAAGMVGGRSGMGAELAVTEPDGPARSTAEAAEGLGAKAEGGMCGAPHCRQSLCGSSSIKSLGERV